MRFASFSIAERIFHHNAHYIIMLFWNIFCNKRIDHSSPIIKSLQTSTFTLIHLYNLDQKCAVSLFTTLVLLKYTLKLTKFYLYKIVGVFPELPSPVRGYNIIIVLYL